MAGSAVAKLAGRLDQELWDLCMVVYMRGRWSSGRFSEAIGVVSHAKSKSG